MRPRDQCEPPPLGDLGVPQGQLVGLTLPLLDVAAAAFS